ncbi:MAG: bifunctional UDP-N-acetylglucosamine diphosphorylase/glucosamine-1-phosphate N-acetyltransferase GlmU [Cyanobacteria bacterium]|nr:bifunctional UDP-N-acetylglucosamine diphosphorylase/glucosamine-1-phosphate N-acetyltransferase GlmU [Cyanobacteria bacterium CG_2015-16_32_12]NCO79098.1 bifunctional UDP-N-acetylglucosamine diphosphorylase/glucosamine-1-phosphate N-acetyltransferase GlmU [Cyanobacteria bacterium CG_2015-22_32_23]NCQ03844.1 bifunctional UDP-N-acetylglucosamine diphosphorylase/glucosamine-1-phosphate N-acetyltransferase GlmU [Cyanobacteria bacterium CG_2015-09_32_10]NCQ40419.1 bifunctional UDP-N-acetylglucosa
MLAVAILAAGKGTRMKSKLPKVLHLLGSKSLVEKAIDSCNLVQPDRQLVIIGYEGKQIENALNYLPQVEFVEQTEQLGTGHAIQQLIPHLDDFSGDLLVLNGDVPLLRPETVQKMVTIHQENNNSATLLTANLPNPQGYGRVFCDENNFVTAIIEDRDCNATQKQNKRINAGVYCFNWQKLREVLPKLSTNNDQQEYYLTEVFDYLDQVMALDVDDYSEINGINDRRQLSAAYEILQQRIKDAWMMAGVTIIDPHSVTIDESVKLGIDVIIEPQTHLRGNTTIASGCKIGPNCLIENSQLGENINVLYSVIIDSKISSNSKIGPYAHLRGGAQLGENCRVGNFVEIKKSTIGHKTNIAHLSYIGDATLGNQVNVGAGTITANYDGVKKHPTIIGHRTKTGSNSVFVAPVTIGEDVTVAAGSVITHDVPNNSLAIAREKQRIIENWKMKSK